MATKKRSGSKPRARVKPEECIVNLRPAGGTEAITLPKQMRDYYGIQGSVKLRPARTGVLVEPLTPSPTLLEDEPEFAIFLEFLSRDALSQPQQLVDAGPYRERDRALIEGALGQ